MLVRGARKPWCFAQVPEMLRGGANVPVPAPPEVRLLRPLVRPENGETWGAAGGPGLCFPGGGAQQALPLVSGTSGAWCSPEAPSCNP